MNSLKHLFQKTGGEPGTEYMPHSTSTKETS